MTITAAQFKDRFPQLLDRFNLREAETLRGALTPIEAQPGRALYRYGDTIDSLYLVWEGGLALSMTVDGRDVPIGMLRPGQWIGSVAVIEPGPAVTTGTVAEPGVFLRLNHAALKALRAAHPRLSGQLLRALSIDLAERLRLYEEGMAGRTQPPGDAEEFAQLCRPLMGIKAL